MPHQTPDGLAWYLGIARSIAGQMKIDAVVQEFAAQIQKVIQYDHLDIVLLAANGRHFHYESGMDTAWNDSGRDFKKTAFSPVRQVLEGQEEYMLTDDAQLDERFNFEGADNEAILSAELRSRIVVPLKVQGSILGSLAISSQKPGCYTNGEVEMARDAADLLSPYLFALARNAEARKSAVKASEAKAREELLRVGALRLTEGMERERRRLGMDLHDQTMADLARMSRRISNLLGEPRILAADLEVLAADLELCRQELHQIVEDLKPGLLELFGFSEAVDAYLTYWVESTGSRLSAKLTDHSGGCVDCLPDLVRVSLYRILQEAINNVGKHSGAAHIDVDIKYQNRLVTITILDDGCGLKGSDLNSSGGVNHMKTRAALISANFVIKARENEFGTIVEVSLPLRNDV